jgi:hypothetical protein
MIAARQRIIDPDTKQASERVGGLTFKVGRGNPSSNFELACYSAVTLL